MDKLFDINYVYDAFPQLIPYIPYTVLLFVFCALVSLLFGVLFALLKIYPITVLSRISSIVVSFLLGIPLLTLLFLFYFGLPEIMLLLGLDIRRVAGIYFVIFTFSLHFGAVISEYIRGAVNSVNHGQFEAAFSIGLSKFATFKRIIMPQAMPVLIPNMANTYLKSVKSTSIAFTVGVIDLMSQAHAIGGATGHLFESYLAVTVIYYLIYLLLNFFFKWIEVRTLRLNNNKIMN